MGLLMGLVAFTGPALALTPAAETPPPVAELQVPSSAIPVATQPAASTKADAAPSTARRDPCPTPKAAMANDPDDLAKVQEDIDRFSLCVQRAQLLERLNDSALKSASATDAALGLSMGGAGMGVPMPGVTPGMPPLPAAAMGDNNSAPVSEITPTVSEENDVPETVAEAPKATWVIREIFGSSVDMQARLISPEGDEVKVKTGSRLPDGAAVTSISPSGVSIRVGKDVKTLVWAGS